MLKYYYRILLTHFSVQLNDLRSAISKEAGRLVCIAAEYGQEDIENFCDKLLSKQCLLKLVNSATKILAENGHECVITLLRYVKAPKVIPKIIEEMSSKNTALTNTSSSSKDGPELDVYDRWRDQGGGAQGRMSIGEDLVYGLSQMMKSFNILSKVLMNTMINETSSY